MLFYLCFQAVKVFQVLAFVRNTIIGILVSKYNFEKTRFTKKIPVIQEL